MNHPKYVLSEYGVQPKKSLGQNFIYDNNLLAQITSLAELSKTDHVLEIGPGIGGLTRQLAKRAGNVVAVELDQRLKPVLNSQIAEFDNVTLIWGDILEFEIDALVPGPYKAVGNIPYYITGAILKYLYSSQMIPTLSVLTVQEEVASRITETPGDMSILAVSVQLYAEAKIEMQLKAGAFWPRPDVNSAVVVLRPWEKPRLPKAYETKFFRLVSAGFSQRRKQVKKGLRALGYSNLELSNALSAVNIDDTRRPQTLSVQEWIDLFWELQKLSGIKDNSASF